MSNIVSIGPRLSVPDFDYKRYDLEAIALEADEAAFSFASTLNSLGSLTAKLILEDAPRLKKFQEIMTQRRCWTKWLDTKFDRSSSTAYNALIISSTLEKLGNEIDIEVITDQLINWSQRALLALAATGDNREAAALAFVKGGKIPTESQVKTFAPITSEEKELLLKTVDEYASQEQMGVEDPKVLRLRVESQASELADNQNKKKPGVADYQRAIALVTGREVEPPTEVRTRVTAQAYEELRQITREKDAVIDNLKAELESYRDRIRQLEQLLQNTGIAA